MVPLASAGFHVVAPDQRGYGRTTGWDSAYDGDLDSFRLTILVRDAAGLVSAIGYRSVAAAGGHDFGSPVAAWCALLRPDVFRSVALMSAPLGVRHRCRSISWRRRRRPRRMPQPWASGHRGQRALPRPGASVRPRRTGLRQRRHDGRYSGACREVRGTGAAVMDHSRSVREQPIVRCIADDKNSGVPSG